VINRQVGIAILARAPVPGQAKTRLIPALGAGGAARLQEWLLLRTVALALDAGLGPVTLWWDGTPDHPALAACCARGPLESRRQPDGDLGDRMHAAIAKSTTPGGTLVIGTDCPALTTAHLREAAAQLANHDAVLYPAEDGGYVLIGLRRAEPELFADMPWGSATVMEQTRQRLRTLGWNWSEPATLWDVDRPDDLERLLAKWPEARAAIG
jgi:rSAM/selenodomain-associated transferase 1